MSYIHRRKAAEPQPNRDDPTEYHWLGPQNAKEAWQGALVIAVLAGVWLIFFAIHNLWP